jgi:hypothetical protein
VRFEAARNGSREAQERTIVDAPQEHGTVRLQRSKLEELARPACSYDRDVGANHQALIGAGAAHVERLRAGEGHGEIVGRVVLVGTEVAVLGSSFVPAAPFACELHELATRT